MRELHIGYLDRVSNLEMTENRDFSANGSELPKSIKIIHQILTFVGIIPQTLLRADGHRRAVKSRTFFLKGGK
jgi:hypothetical protein